MRDCPAWIFLCFFLYERDQWPHPQRPSWHRDPPKREIKSKAPAVRGNRRWDFFAFFASSTVPVKKKERKDSELHVGKKNKQKKSHFHAISCTCAKSSNCFPSHLYIYIYPRRVLWWHGVLTRLNRRLTSPRSREGKRRTKSLSLLRLFALPARFIYTHFLRP